VLFRSPGYDHIASPEVVIHDNFLELYYHCPYGDFQYTFIATTQDGVEWQYDNQVQGLFYLRIIEQTYGIAKYKNEGAVAYIKEGNTFKEVKKFLPNMRHCAYYNKKLYWSCIGDAPETIFRGTLSLPEFVITDVEEVLKPSYDFETGKYLARPSTPGPATKVNEVRDPYVIEVEGTLYIFYAVRGEEAIALAIIEE
jgi:hypothetical protein